MYINVTNFEWTTVVYKFYLLIMPYIVAFIFLNLFFIWAVVRNDLSVIDIYWSLGFFFVSLTSFYTLDQKTLFHFIFLVMISLWSLRLSGYLAWRLLSHGKEDPRYTEMRKNWKGNVWVTAYYRVYLVQFALMALISTPLYFYLAGTNESLFKLNHFVGMTLFVYGYIFQVWGDFGLAKFKSDPANKGKVYTQGAWKYSQHPNYFGESSIWIGLFCFAMNVSPWWTVISPITITFLLLKVSGIPLLKRSEKYAKNLEYQSYKQKTSLFVPWFPG